MANIYINDKTKLLLEKCFAADGRTQDGEVHYLVRQRAFELGLITAKEAAGIDDD